MNVDFFKYQGAGNDFIIIDSRKLRSEIFDEASIKKLCHRNFGIGADGLILLQNAEDPKLDFRMKYFNSDGKEGTMCGNGGRCIVAFAKQLGIINTKAVFEGIDGFHEAYITDNLYVKLKMIDVPSYEKLVDGYLLETGSTHFVIFQNEIDGIDVFNEGRKIRYEKRFGKPGTNVNFVEKMNSGHIKLRTYERGVENETLACGTGAVAAAISSYLEFRTDKNSYIVDVKGGEVEVSFSHDPEKGFSNIWLYGPASFVYKGNIEL